MEDGTPKGAEMILQERGFNTQTLKLDDMRIILGNHDDFKSETNALTKFLASKDQIYFSFQVPL